MNIQEMDLMNTLAEGSYKTQRELSMKTGYSLGTVNASVRSLIEDKYLNKEFQLTEKAKGLFEAHKPKRAIILAAGVGMRMVPINVEVSKGMLEVKGEPLVERIIKHLQEVGIEDISIVVGFMKEQYEYLIDEYQVKLVYNGEYALKNNLYSIAKVIDKIDNAYIIPCDIWCENNPFHTEELYPWYMVSSEKNPESVVRINRKRELKLTDGKEDGNQMLGIAYVCGEAGKILKDNIQNMLDHRKNHHCFWEDAAFTNNKMLFWAKEVAAEDVKEINTLEELRELDKSSNQLDTEIFDIISSTLKCEKEEIVEIEALKKGMTNRSFRFRCRDKRYIMRIPGEGTGKMINRQQEYAVYQVVGEEGICDPICYMNPENGYKITEFLESARVCDAENLEDVKACMSYLNSVHDKNLEVPHVFDIFDQIEKYESYWQGEKSIYRDYLKTKEKIYELKAYVDRQEKKWALTHIDAVPDNFLFVNDRIYLIDWEYSGMQDPHVDVAMFAIYSMYEREQIETLIDLYFEQECPEETRTKIYCYIAMCGLLWSNWCEFKRICGVEFGEYSLKQYRYAKEYYKIAKERINND